MLSFKRSTDVTFIVGHATELDQHTRTFYMPVVAIDKNCQVSVPASATVIFTGDLGGIGMSEMLICCYYQSKRDCMMSHKNICVGG